MHLLSALKVIRPFENSNYILNLLVLVTILESWVHKSLQYEFSLVVIIAGSILSLHTKWWFLLYIMVQFVFSFRIHQTNMPRLWSSTDTFKSFEAVEDKLYLPRKILTILLCICEYVSCITWDWINSTLCIMKQP